MLFESKPDVIESLNIPFKLWLTIYFALLLFTTRFQLHSKCVNFTWLPTYPVLRHPGSSLHDTTVTAAPGINTSSSCFPALIGTSRWQAPRGASFNPSHTVFTTLSTSSSSCSIARDRSLRTSEIKRAGSLKNIALGCKVLAARQWRGSGAEWGDVMMMVPSDWGSANSWVARVCRRDRISASWHYWRESIPHQ